MRKKINLNNKMMMKRWIKKKKLMRKIKVKINQKVYHPYLPDTINYYKSLDKNHLFIHNKCTLFSHRIKDQIIQLMIKEARNKQQIDSISARCRMQDKQQLKC